MKRLRSTSMEIYVKGAPEVMSDICDRDSCRFLDAVSTIVSPCPSVPQDYDDLLSYYTRRGYRVIAIAGKSIEGLSWLKAQRMKRLVQLSSCEQYAESHLSPVNKQNLDCAFLA